MTGLKMGCKGIERLVWDYCCHNGKMDGVGIGNCVCGYVGYLGCW